MFIVREMSQSENPSDKGTELKRFEDWEEARNYVEGLYKEDNIKAYISEE